MPTPNLNTKKYLEKCITEENECLKKLIESLDEMQDDQKSGFFFLIKSEYTFLEIKCRKRKRGL